MRNNPLRTQYLVLVLFLASTLSGSVSARLFPNISSIPPGLIPNITSTAWDAFQQFAGCRQGEKRDGLNKIKQYFHRFGYIPTVPSTNFTDDFDDALEAAIKTYQKNFNLNETGELDTATLQILTRPRCGNADIVNGTTTMNSGKPTSTLFHTVAHYSFFPGQPVWPENKRELTYAFYNSISDTAKEVFARAFARWSQVTPLNFTMTESVSTADIRIGFFTGEHGDGEAFDGVLGTLAHAFSPPSGHFHLDNDETWVAEGDVTQSTVSSAIDLESVAIHEIGHLLGLGHSSVEEAIMYPSITARTRKVELAQDDIDGIQLLYGSNPSYNGSATASSGNETTPSSSAGPHGLVGPRWWVGLFLGLVLLFL